MILIPRCARSKLRGFSLVELSIVVAILSVVVTLGLEAAASFVNKTATATTRERLAVIDDALDKFFKEYGRIPCPADRVASPTTQTSSAVNYGVENCLLTTTITTPGIGGGLMYGSVPIYMLNLPRIYQLDGYGSKFNYVATINLTYAGGSTTSFNRFASSGGTSAQNGTAGIEIRTGELAQPCNTGSCQVVADPAASPPSGAAYFLFSSGADQRGALSVQGNATRSCAFVPSTELRPDAQNCVYGNASIRTAITAGTGTAIPDNVFYDDRLNPGYNLKSYYDDIAIWRTKAQL